MRHLRIISHRLREILQKENTTWKAYHLKRTSLSTDGLTKPLMHQAFQRFFKMMAMQVNEEKVESEVKIAKVGRVGGSDLEDQNKVTTLLKLGSVLCCCTQCC